MQPLVHQNQKVRDVSVLWRSIYRQNLLKLMLSASGVKTYLDFRRKPEFPEKTHTSPTQFQWVRKQRKASLRCYATLYVRNRCKTDRKVALLRIRINLITLIT